MIWAVEATWLEAYADMSACWDSGAAPMLENSGASPRLTTDGWAPFPLLRDTDHWRGDWRPADAFLDTIAREAAAPYVTAVAATLSADQWGRVPNIGVAGTYEVPHRSLTTCCNWWPWASGSGQGVGFALTLRHRQRRVTAEMHRSNRPREGGVWADMSDAIWSYLPRQQWRVWFSKYR